MVLTGLGVGGRGVHPNKEKGRGGGGGKKGVLKCNQKV